MTKATIISVDRSDVGALAEVFVAGRDVLESRLVFCGAPSDVEDCFDSLETRSKLVMPKHLNSGGDIGSSCARTARLIEFLAGELAQSPPDIVLVLGDRYELLSVTAACVLSRTPLAHISGGEITRGSFDEQTRHAVTKAAHLHFVANHRFAERLYHMGEERWRVHVTGDPGLDRIKRCDMATAGEIQGVLGVRPSLNTVLVAYHPVTNNPEETWRGWSSIAAALENETEVIVTASNLDPQGSELRGLQKSWCSKARGRHFVQNLGQKNFLGVINSGAVLLGNSSSGIWEAPSLRAPAVNVGSRQQGRLRAQNVIDVHEPEVLLVKAALREARRSCFRASLDSLANPYGDGFASQRIAAALALLPGRRKLLEKVFCDFGDTAPPEK